MAFATVAEIVKDLKNMIEKMDEVMKNGYNLRNENSETKVMVHDKDNNIRMNIKMYSEKLEDLNKFYLTRKQLIQQQS